MENENLVGCSYVNFSFHPIFTCLCGGCLEWLTGPKSGVVRLITRATTLLQNREKQTQFMLRPAKRARLQRHLVDLPQNVLDQVLSYLTSQDLRNLASVDQNFRSKLLPNLFYSIKATWEQIIELHKADSGMPRALVRKLRITLSNSYNEYQQNTFGQLLSPQVFPALAEVCVNSVNLSYWLKYNKCSHVSSLTLYSDNVFRGVKMFQLSHVEHFENLRLLCLHNYHFLWSDESAKPAARLWKLCLHDCSWEYPFDVAHFNLQDTLQDLTITYSSNNNAFILLERFLTFIGDPFAGHSASLRNVRIDFVDITENKKLLTLTILLTFLTSFSGIETLHLGGWTANLPYLRGVLMKHQFEYPVLLRMDVESLERVNMDKFHENLLRVRNLRLKVTAV